MKILIALAITVLAGCAVTEDVTTKMKLSERDSRAVEDIRTKASATCTTYTYNPAIPSDQDRKIAQTKITSQGSISRLFLSREGWYKALFRAQGVTDHVFYDPKTGRLVCGQKQWDAFANTSAIKFQELGVPGQPSL